MIRKFVLALIFGFFFCGTSFAQDVIVADLSATSPAAASTVAGTPVTGLQGFRSMAIYANLQGATGGTLDIYLQFTPDLGTTWVDYAHFTQKAAAGAATKQVWTVSRSAQQLTIATVGTGTSPALTANSIIGGEWGDQMRVVFVAGTSTSAGALQTIKLVLTR